VVAAPFNEALSEAVERLETGVEAAAPGLRGMLRELGRSIREELAKAAIYLALVGGLWLLALGVPLFGPLLQSVLGVALTALYLALDYVDLPASRRGWPVGRRLGLVRAHPRELLGFGLGVWVLLIVPVVNLLTMPAAVAGGALLFLELHGRASPAGDNSGRVP
jgi:CysZ protein